MQEFQSRLNIDEADASPRSIEWSSRADEDRVPRSGIAGATNGGSKAGAEATKVRRMSLQARSKESAFGSVIAARGFRTHSRFERRVSVALGSKAAR